MLRTIDRYIIRETLPMVFLSLLVLTFMLMIPPIMDQAQQLLTKGVDFATVATLMGLLIPQGLGVTIPMAVLIGLLMGLGRLSGDRETVAMQACGISIGRMLRPVAVLALLATAATTYVTIVALPDSNQAFREIVFRQLASYTADQVEPQVFDRSLPGVNLYVRGVEEQGTKWTDVLLAITQDEGQPILYVAEQGRIIVDYDAQTVDIELRHGSIHRVPPNDPSSYTQTKFTTTLVPFDAETIFDDGGGPPRGFGEMSLPELEEQMVQIVAAGGSPHNAIMEIHKRFSLPSACLAFALIALALGVTNRKDGKLASFALGIGVIFAYYILLYGGQAMVKGALISPHLAMWLPNIVIGGVGVVLLVRRTRSAERPVSFRLPFVWPTGAPTPDQASPTADEAAPAAMSTLVQTHVSPSRWSVVGILDRYVAVQYLRVVALSFIGLLGIFYLSTFVDLSDKVFKGEATLLMIGEYFWYQTPQWVYFVLPISTLVASLITIGVLTRTSELTVMKACGISLYRASLPLLLFSLVWSAALFGMSETFLAEANRVANELDDEIRGRARPTFDALNRTWITSPDGAMYNYGSFDLGGEALHGLTVYRFDPNRWRIAERAFFARAVYDTTAQAWQGHDAWVRQFSDDDSESTFVASDQREFTMEAPEYFAAEPPDALRMNYQELDRYIGELAGSGVNVVPLRVSLERKLSFPLVTLILTLIAVPFAVSTGRHGTLYGVGIGIMLAISYWVVISVFAAFGSAGLLAPILAAWAPNILFGGSAIYLLLTVRT